MNNTFQWPSMAAWDGDTAAARALQSALAKQVRVVDDLPNVRWLAGVDVGFEDSGRVTRAAAVLLEAATLTPVATQLARLPTGMPYIPGLLSFRELPAVLQALSQLSELPDLIMVDGQGIAHPRGLGIAAHLGVLCGLPTIGVAKTILVGEHVLVGPAKGDSSPLRFHGRVIGNVLRTRERVKPLIVSPGHRISVATATQWVLRCCTRYRLPEPTRLADRLASQRDLAPGTKRA